MTRRLSLIIAVMFSMMVATTACQQKDIDGNEDEHAEEQELSPVTLTVQVGSVNNIFEKKPSITLHVENPNNVEVTAEALFVFTKDTMESYLEWSTSEQVPANGSKDIPYDNDKVFDPGFYQVRCQIKNNRNAAANISIGVDPFEIVSAPDKQADYDEFWAKAKAQLPKVNDDNVKFIELTSRSSAKRKVYLVEYKSVPNEEGGTPETVRGYYCEPTDGKKHPVFFHFYGYDDQKPTNKAYCPTGGSTPYADFYVSTRGQMVNNRTANLRSDGIEEDFVNTYGDWFAYNFGKYDGYYYRGAFMDCVQAVRIAASRPTTDTGKLFAEGSSQGGALSYATASLSDWPFVAIAPNVAFLGDFPDYFKIVSWPAGTAKAGQKKMGMTDEQMYAFLSYYDTKNLASTLTCAVIAHIGLIDGTCPPHTNIAPYNNLLTPEADKVMYFSPKVGHGYHPNWENLYMDFFKKRGLE